MKWCFGIITDGKGNELLKQVIRSVEIASGVSPMVCGETSFVPISNSLKIHAPELARDGRLGAMRNLLAEQCYNCDVAVLMDDDIILDKDFVHGFDKFGYDDWDVASCKIHNPDGTRYWDWKIHLNGLNWLIPYDKTSKHISLTGGLIIAKSHIFDMVCWNPSLGFYEQEDVEFSNILQRQKYKIAFNPYSTAVHMGPYTQRGDGVYRTDL